ncbi:NADH dehydrogenase [ubiquinone] 1 alpha subcomplex assembly factor 3 [Exaiptasia diaphana]|uniref:NADH dehydrogenase [ubiquinone] 1 alpha subcomplex assembly factor 3 n=1 Tax=Exaiptasia diaphana TaxID=2652724 RepID=A0A913Y8A1_EXADI|nr:NADH dehydrogenase [ubiquinone] 1 alpha subcomplex assembly factor 3 [Exaiptasia diaphana]KXJ21824.1 NADH dehydrogenase [ubiquinone] 1 alpha subcomplex assembly factor 3 [Exaiptasia diaphana]
MAAVCGRLLVGLTCRRSLAFIPSRLAHTVEKEPMKSTVTFLGENEQQEGKDIPPYVTRYSSRGFRIKNIKVFGSVAIVPDAFYHWKVQNPNDITTESLSLFTMMDPPIEILVVGTGDRIVRLSPDVHKHMKQHNVMLEVQDTKNAAATFNFLLEEDRLVGAALIPPQTDTK